MGSVFALAALGIIIIFRTSYVTNFAQGTMAMFNAYFAATLLNSLGWNIWITALASIIFAFFIGVGVDYFVMRQAKKVSPVGKQIITMGLITVFLGFAPLIFAKEALPFQSFFPTGAIRLGDISISFNLVFNFFLSISIMGALFVVLQYTKYGLAVRATASNEWVARMMGIPTQTVTLFTWGASASLGVLSAIIVAPMQTVVSAGMMGDVQISAFLALVLGGFQTFYGPVIASYIIAIVMNLTIYLGSALQIPLMQQWGLQLLYVAILFFLVFKPNGLFGKKIIKKV